jgi:hypothetical protein
MGLGNTDIGPGTEAPCRIPAGKNKDSGSLRNINVCLNTQEIIIKTYDFIRRLLKDEGLWT